MRLSKPVSLAVTAAAALTAVPAVPVAQAADHVARAGDRVERAGDRVERAGDRVARAGDRVARVVPVGGGAGRGPLPGCAEAGEREFPVRTRIHGGPDTYDAGGGYRTWYIDLTNTTGATCHHIHPVVVLVDDRRALTADQLLLEFYVGDRPHPVTFERTDEDEHIGVLGSDDDTGFAGFTVAPGQTLSVRVRLAVTSDAVANDVVANAAVVQRQADDGSWVGQSDDYRFRIAGSKGQGRDQGKETGGEPRGDAGVRERDPRGAADAVPDGLPFAEELAGTGLSSPRVVLAAAVGALFLLAAGTTVLVLARRSGGGSGHNKR